MKSQQELFRTGMGPSSSHTMGPRRAALRFAELTPRASSYRVRLLGSLASTGRGHLTDRAIEEALAPRPVELLWAPDDVPKFHPNGMDFEALDHDGNPTRSWRVYSIGGGALREEGPDANNSCPSIYPIATMRDALTWCEENGSPLWKLVETFERQAGNDPWKFLSSTWKTMNESIRRGIETEDVLPGLLRLNRKAPTVHARVRHLDIHARRTGLLAAYALAVAEENASGGRIVTAPTCGSSGVVPAVLRYLTDRLECSEILRLHALAIAGLIGNFVKYNGSISGAEVGCQGEIGTACAMAAGAATYLMGGTTRQVEYAAEMGLEHHLGLTCDPVEGLVQIPCIERNALAATRALDCAEYALLGDGGHRVSFDRVVDVMTRTGKDLPSLYRETGTGGLAAIDLA